MSALGYGAAVGEAALSALTARISSVESGMPKPAATAPPMIANAADKGTAPRFALEDHTHQSNVQSKRVQVTGSDGTATWVYGTPFDVIPVVNCTAETAGGATYINIPTILEGSVSTTQATIVVQRIVKSITLPTVATSLLGLVLSLFGFAPIGVTVHCIARKPS